MQYDVIVIGAGISGLSAASLLAKRGLKVAVVEHSHCPGGSCGIFKREGVIFEQGAAMLYGFGERGFNAHRFLFNCLEESFQAVKHELLYVVNYNNKRVRFLPDVDQFAIELSQAFPDQTKNIKRFYRDMNKLYSKVICGTPNYTTPDEVDPKFALKSLLKHPASYLKFLSYMNISAKKLLQQYFTSPEILSFFNKLTSTYCYATLDEASAIMASVMFVDNHVGGSYYPAGSTLFLPGKLEKVIEENSGDMIYGRTVTKLLFENDKPNGVLLDNGQCLYGQQIIYSGTVWNLYGKLLAVQKLDEREEALISQTATYRSIVFYAMVDRQMIPEGTCPIEMLASNPDDIDESEITVYMFSLDDHTLCPGDRHTVTAIGPSFRSWDTENSEHYQAQKKEEISRITEILNRRFPGFKEGVRFCELATPETIRRYTMKNCGAVAGPKQMLGQHLLHRQTIRTRWDTLFCCGESTVMGTGTPTVTTSGIAAANAVLKKRGLETYVWKPDMKNYVHIIKPPLKEGWMKEFYPEADAEIMLKAQKCLYCSNPLCCEKKVLNVPGILRRVSCGNFIGAKNLMLNAGFILDRGQIRKWEETCAQAQTSSGAVDILEIINYIKSK